MDPWPLIGATVASAVWIAVSPYRRLLVREALRHPLGTATIERDPVTGNWRPYAKPDDSHQASGDVGVERR